MGRRQVTGGPVVFRLAALALLVGVLVQQVACLSRAKPAASSAAASGAARRTESLGRPRRVGQIANGRVNESSGIVASRKHPGAYWTHNDSGGAPVLYAIDATGKSLGECRLTGARNIDWEDIAIDGAGHLYVGDFGDNQRRRRTLTIYQIPEPDPRQRGAVKVSKIIHYRFPRGHGPFDCEAMFVRGGWVYLVTKERLTARLYRVSLTAPAGQAVTAETLGTVPGAAWITAADISADGRRIALLSYLGFRVYDLPAPLEKVVAAASAASGSTRPAGVIRDGGQRRSVHLGQAEAICWVAGHPAETLIITNEQRDVYRAGPDPATGPATSATSRPR